jgi:hypothetical protein
VAVKLYDGRAIDEALREECFLRERAALGALSHPHVVRLVAAGYDQPRAKLYVVIVWPPRTAAWSSKRWNRETAQYS